jgi:hypothetical protein
MEPTDLFVVEGFVADRRLVARWTNGVLLVPVEVLRRAEIIVALGERFRRDGGELVAASLDDGPLPALLTVIRAFDKIINAVVSSEMLGGALSYSTVEKPEEAAKAQDGVS